MMGKIENAKAYVHKQLLDKQTGRVYADMSSHNMVCFASILEESSAKKVGKI